MKKLNTQEFIERAKQKHGDYYDYSKVEYEKACIKVVIGCPYHGEWLQRPNDHLTGYGCPTCKFEKLATLKRSNKEQFIEKAQQIHGTTYNYNDVDYKNAVTKVKIYCFHHGYFWCTPDKHLYGIGCTKCSHGTSRGELRIQKYLDDINVYYEREQRFEGLCGATPNSRLRYDFFLPNHNLLIEYDGEHHFYPINTKGKLSPKNITHKHLATIENDKKKTEYAKRNGYQLLRIPYTDFNNIETILEGQGLQHQDTVE